MQLALFTLKQIGIYMVEILNSPMGHDWALHGPCCCAFPTQALPPLAGEGLSHALVLVLIPPAHDAEHTDQAPHVPQNPSTKIFKIINIVETIIKFTYLNVILQLWLLVKLPIKLGPVP